jgi:hypothetical protein
MPRAIKILEFRVSGSTIPSGVAKPGAGSSGIARMLPIRHIEPFFHRYHDLFCCNHLNSFCESSNLYAVNGIRSMSPHRPPRLFQLLFSGRIVSPRLWRVLLQLKSCTLLSSVPRRSPPRDSKSPYTSSYNALFFNPLLPISGFPRERCQNSRVNWRP